MNLVGLQTGGLGLGLLLETGGLGFGQIDTQHSYEPRQIGPFLRHSVRSKGDYFPYLQRLVRLLNCCMLSIDMLIYLYLVKVK